MRVTLMRHGFAGTSIKDDPEADDARSLKPDGIAAARAVAKWLLEEGYEPTEVVCGPTARARETAKIAGSILGAPVRVDSRLYVGGPMTVVLREMADSGAKRVMIVTHDDVIENSLHKMDEGGDAIIDKIAMAEARVVDIDRDDLCWDERDRCRPSDLGLTDYYDHRAIIVHEGD